MIWQDFPTTSRILIYKHPEDPPDLPGFDWLESDVTAFLDDHDFS